jgi:hypothetical protein
MQSDAPSRVETDLPAVDMPIPIAVHGPVVRGEAISLGGDAPGSVRWSDETFGVIPFATVDCGHCGGGGWNQVHMLLWDEARSCAGTAIPYLDPSRPHEVTLAYGLLLPQVRPQQDTLVFNADWSAP